MKSISLAGVVLVVLGVLALTYQGITYTHREKILDAGPIHATKDTSEVWRSLAELVCLSPARGKRLDGRFSVGDG
jgi:hypothetical protein